MNVTMHKWMTYMNITMRPWTNQDFKQNINFRYLFIFIFMILIVYISFSSHWIEGNLNGLQIIWIFTFFINNRSFLYWKHIFDYANLEVKLWFALIQKKNTYKTIRIYQITFAVNFCMHIIVMFVFKICTVLHETKSCNWIKLNQ